MSFFPPAVLSFAASRGRRARKCLLWIGVGLSLYTLVGFFLVPPAKAWQPFRWSDALSLARPPGRTGTPGQFTFLPLLSSS